MRGGSKPQPIEDRLDRWTCYEPNTGCWLWTGALSADGYGKFDVQGRTRGVHKFTWERERGPVPPGFQLDHLCRQRACRNIDHLEPVTCQINVLRSNTMGAVAVRTNHCKHGHEFTPENTVWRNRAGGGRQCRECRRLCGSAWYEQNIERQRANQQAWQQSNRARCADYARAYRARKKSAARAVLDGLRGEE